MGSCGRSRVLVAFSLRCVPFCRVGRGGWVATHLRRPTLRDPPGPGATHPDPARPTGNRRDPPRPGAAHPDPARSTRTRRDPVLLQQYCCNSTVATVLSQALALGLALALALGLDLALALQVVSLAITRPTKLRFPEIAISGKITIFDVPDFFVKSGKIWKIVLVDSRDQNEILKF